MESFYDGWQMPKEKFKEGFAGIDKHYQGLSEKYGYEINPPEQMINQLGYIYLNEKDFNKAIEVFEENVKRYSMSANVYDSLGEVLEKNGQMAEAEKSYAKAVKIGEEQKHSFLDVYRKNYERVQKNLTSK